MYSISSFYDFYIRDNIKKIIIVASSIIIACFIIVSSYMIKVYFEYKNDKEKIFEKIDSFSDALKKSNDTKLNLYSGDEEEKEESLGASVFLDRDGNIIAKFATEKQMLVRLTRMPYFLSRGFVVIEDERFFKHRGFNVVRLTLGIIKNIITFGRAPGGSTISQQLAKILFTKQKRNIKRKAYEFYCTLELERKFSKNEILQIYLNSIYFGHGVYGIASASQFYFGKEASELNIAEASLLIGMNRAPEIYSPIRSADNARRIQKVVLNRFVKEGFLTKEESKNEYERFWSKFYNYGVLGSQSFWKTDINRSGYVTEHIRQLLEKEFSHEKITRGGLIVETTIDINRQILAEKVLKDQLKNIKVKIIKKAEEKKIDGYKESDVDKIESSFVSLDYKNGEVLVLIGGSGFSFSNQLNRALYSYRQIGSTVKPFIYAKALSDKQISGQAFHPFTKFKDEIITYTVNGKKYTPRDFDTENHKYGSIVSLYDAVKQSLNTVSVAVLNKMNISETASFIRRAGFLDSADAAKRVPEVLSLALGTCELSSMELASMYAVFARAGKRVHPYIIKKISDINGNVYYDYDKEENIAFEWLYPKEYKDDRELLKPQVAYEVIQLLKAVFDKGGTGYWASYLAGLNKPAYGKSGTSQDFKDTWFVGITPSEVSASWVGFDNNKPILLACASTAAVIWSDYNSKTSGSVTVPFDIPVDMRLLKVCMESGLIATDNCPKENVKDFYFWNDGPVPENCYIHDKKTEKIEDVKNQ